MNESLIKTVQKIIKDVQKNGDSSLVRFAKRFDKVALTPKNILVTKIQMKEAYKSINPSVRAAIQDCANRITAFHKEERKKIPFKWKMNQKGITLGQRYAPVHSTGVYVPGGRFAYPSTVLMSAIPAKIAGVKRIVAVSPPGRLMDEVLAAAHIAGISEFYRVGGPAAIAALAYGTKTISPVDLIVGPGNALVTEAKRQVFGKVGIDLLAGPSELVVITDGNVPASFVARDLMAQAEHDPDARAFLISPNSEFIRQVGREVRGKFRRQCQLIKTSNLNDAVTVANRIAPEHLELIVKTPKTYLDKLTNAGAIFIGPWSPNALGDYWAGPSHVLPTGNSARFASGLSVMTFLKRSSLIELNEKAFHQNWRSAHTLAQIEGLIQHAKSISIRESKNK